MPRSNMAFAVAYPEQLRQAVAPESADYVYLNSSLALFSDPPRVLRECWAVLVPGGSLLIECAVAESEGPAAARALREEHEVAADRGSVFDHRVPTVPGDDATYRLVALEARKPR